MAKRSDWREPAPLDPILTFAVRITGDTAWLQCQHCKGTFDRDAAVVVESAGERWGCARCAITSYVGTPESAQKAADDGPSDQL